MKLKIDRKYLVQVYSDSLFNYLISDHRQKYMNIIKFFKGVKRTFEGFRIPNEFFYEILLESVEKTVNRLTKNRSFYQDDINFVIDFFCLV